MAPLNPTELFVPEFRDESSYTTASHSCATDTSELSAFLDERSPISFRNTINYAKNESNNTFKARNTLTLNVSALRRQSSPPPSYPIASSVASKPKIMNKADKERAQRMIERLDQAEIQIQMRSRRASSWPNKNKRQINQGIRERAETQLRLSQIDVARNFFERRLYQQSPSTGPVPMEILKIVKDVSSPNTMSRPREVV